MYVYVVQCAEEYVGTRLVDIYLQESNADAAAEVLNNQKDGLDYFVEVWEVK